MVTPASEYSPVTVRYGPGSSRVVGHQGPSRGKDAGHGCGRGRAGEGVHGGGQVEPAARRHDREPRPVDGHVGEDICADRDGHRPLVAREDAYAERAGTDHDLEARVPERDAGGRGPGEGGAREGPARGQVRGGLGCRRRDGTRRRAVQGRGERGCPGTQSDDHRTRRDDCCAADSRCCHRHVARPSVGGATLLPVRKCRAARCSW